MIRVLDLKIATDCFIARLATGEYDYLIMQDNKKEVVYLHIAHDDEGLQPFVSHLQKISVLEKKREKLAQILYSLDPSQLGEATERLEKINDELAELGGIAASAGMPLSKGENDDIITAIPDSPEQDSRTAKWAHLAIFLKNYRCFGS